MTILGFKIDFWTFWGFISQGFFFSRFIVQWYYSEKQGKIVVPHIFWILSLFGTSMLLIYAIVRADIVFFIASILQFFLFSRNLLLSKKSLKSKRKIAQEKQGVLSPFLRKQRYKQALKFINNNEVILDFGCGSGEFKQNLPKNIRYFGIDTKNNWNGNSNYLFKSAVGKPLPKKLSKKMFTTISALALIEHLKKPGILFNQSKNILKKNGKIIITTPHPIGRLVHDLGSKIGIFSHDASEEHEKFFDKRTLEALAKKYNFKLLKYKRFLFGFNQLFVFRLD